MNCFVALLVLALAIVRLDAFTRARMLRVMTGLKATIPSIDVRGNNIEVGVYRDISRGNRIANPILALR